MTYDLRRLRRHGLIERVPHSHRYRVTPLGARMAMLYVRLHARALRPTASLPASGSGRGHQAFERLDIALANFLEEVELVASKKLDSTTCYSLGQDSSRSGPIGDTEVVVSYGFGPVDLSVWTPLPLRCSCSYAFIRALAMKTRPVPH
jgi:hypothetical protein